MIIAAAIILAGFRIIIFNQSLYKEEFYKYKIYKDFNSDDIVDKNLYLLISYLRGKDPALETDFFNEREKLHLADVKSLIKNLRLFLYILLGFIILIFLYLSYNGEYNTLLKSLISGSVLAISIIILLYLLSLTDFGSVFMYFHLISFKNNYWLLNPETDNLIKMFPEEIFFDLAVYALMSSLILSFIILFTSILLYYSVFYRKFNIKKFFQ